MIKGSSTGLPPIHVSIRRVVVNMIIIKNLCDSLFLIIKLLDMGNKYKIKMAENIAITPPNLLGIDRRIAYAHKKYHSGLI